MQANSESANLVRAAGGLFGAALGSLAFLLVWAALEGFGPSAILTACGYVIPVMLGIFALKRCVQQWSEGYAGQGLGTVLFAALTVAAATLPEQQLLAGTRVSRLTLLGVSAPYVTGNAPYALWLFLLALCCFALGEASLPGHPGRVLGPTAVLARTERRAMYLSLLAIGVFSVFVFGSEEGSQAFSQRGQVRGAGLSQLLTDCLLDGVALGVLKKHWNSKVLCACSVIATLLYVRATTSRSPLLFLALAVLLRLALEARQVIDSRRAARRQSRSGSKQVRIIAAALLVLYLSAVLVVSFAQWRTEVVQTGHGSFVQQLGRATENPFSPLAEKGSLDTLDGLVLAIHANRGDVGATWTNPGMAIVGLIPYQLWPDKPADLGPTVSHYYTDFGGGAGIFLSGPGYLYLVFDGGVPVALGFLLFGALTSFLVRRWSAAPLFFLFWFYFLARFIVGGDAFDLQYVIELVLALIPAAVVAVAVDFLAVSPTAARHKALEPHRSAPSDV